MFAFDAQWLGQHDEDVIDPTLPIIDPHHHLWDRDNSYLFNDLLDDTGLGEAKTHHNIRATVYIQCRSMYRAGVSEELAPVGETEFVNGVAAQSATGYYGEMRACAGPTTTINVEGQAFPVLPLAHQQIGARLGIPSKYYDRMRVEAPALLADDVMVVMAPWVDPLVASGVAADVNPLDQPEPLELIERSAA